MISHIPQSTLQLRKALPLNSSLNLFYPLQKHDFHDKLNYNYLPFLQKRYVIQWILILYLINTGAYKNHYNKTVKYIQVKPNHPPIKQDHKIVCICIKFLEIKIQMLLYSSGL